MNNAAASAAPNCFQTYLPKIGLGKSVANRSRACRLRSDQTNRRSSITSCNARECEPVAARKLARTTPRTRLEFCVAFVLGPARQDRAHQDRARQDLAYLARFAAGFATRPEQCWKRAAGRP